MHVNKLGFHTYFVGGKDPNTFCCCTSTEQQFYHIIDKPTIVPIRG